MIDDEDVDNGNSDNYSNNDEILYSIISRDEDTYESDGD
ncbi:unnamed protein product, partial [Rotaria sordida]